MIVDSIARLRTGSVNAYDFGSRYAQLLELLWRQVDEVPTDNNRYTNNTVGSTPMVNRQPSGQQDEFSWLDLQAVGEFITGEQDPMDFDFSGENLQQFVQASRRGSMSWNDLGWPDNDMNRFF